MPIHGYPGGVITANPTAPTSSVASGVWTTEQQLAAVAAGNWPFTIPTQQISRSLRFNSADSAYLSRTFGSNGNQKAWTLSFWVKRSKLGDFFDLFGVNAASPDQKNFRFNSDDTLTFYVQTSAATVVYLQTSQVFRDVSAWYHVVLVIDTANATSTDRIRLYANGSRITAFSSTTYPSLNLNIPSYNTAITHYLGSFGPGTSLFDGYMTEINFIDGQALTPSSFGQTNASTGVWEPIAYSGTYGTNGFYLNFSDNSGTTSTTLGKDYSGNGNNWTPNNFSVTAGAGNDSLVDSPTSYGTDTGVGGEVRGNYCTWNPLSTGRTLSNGNLDYAGSASGVAKGTVGVSSGKWYWEILANGANSSAGVASVSLNPTVSYCGSTADSWCLFTSGDRYNNGSATSGYSTFTTNDIISIALDMDNGKVYWAKNGVWQGSSNPATGTNAGYTNLSGYTITPANGNNNTNDLGTANFGQRAFAYTAPSGFKALCTQNLPTPTIGATSTTQANDYMNVALWTGTGASQNITGLGFQPDFVWGKMRNSADKHYLFNQLAGVNKFLSSNLTDAETTDATILTSFNADGFTLGTSVDLNRSGGYNYVGWAWNAGGSTVTNTSGTISAQVRANTTSGFSIVTYTGTGSNATVGHGIGTAPQMVIIKQRNGIGTYWCVYHTSLASGFAIYLNADFAAGSDPGTFNSTAPTSTVFSIGTSTATNTNGNTYVAYCFAPVAGYSAFGSYTGNGSADGPFVYTGFRPAFVMGKASAGTNAAGSNWFIVDLKRNTYNVMDLRLFPNLNFAENTQNVLDFTSNGFKIRTTNTAENTNGMTVVYMAFAENPFKYSLAR